MAICQIQETDYWIQCPDRAVHDLFFNVFFVSAVLAGGNLVKNARKYVYGAAPVDSESNQLGVL